MRTTITLDEGLLEQLRRRAAESGTSVSNLVTQAVRLFLRSPRPSESPDTFDLVTYGAGGRFSRYNIDKAAALIEAEDIERFRGGR